MKKVAVTGGLACGKTSVCHFFEELGAFVASADVIVHQLLLTDASLQGVVVSLLGSEVYVNGTIDRKEVAKRVFADPSTLDRMEQIMHPRVQAELSKQFQAAQKSKEHALFVAEVPLLFEAAMEKEFDASIAVTSKQARERYTGTDYEARMNRQLLPAEKARRADIAIQNDGTLNDLKRDVAQVFVELTQGFLI